MEVWHNLCLTWVSKVNPYNKINLLQMNSKKRSRQKSLKCQALILQRSYRKNTKLRRNSGRQAWALPRRLLQVIGSRTIIRLRQSNSLKRNKYLMNRASKKQLKSTIDPEALKLQS